MKIILSKFLTELQKLLRNNYRDICEKILLEIEQLDSDCIREIDALKSPSCTYLDGALNNISKNLSPVDVLIKSISEKLVWREASRGVPDFFKGGYAFAEIIGEQGLIVSENIRIGLFLQKPYVNYPFHAHEAEELYIILSGTASWKIDDKMFSVIPGSIIKHQSCQDHATFTEEETLFALWIWTGKIKGRYWFRGYSEDDCPLEN
ncbi:MAG: dimethylsulfonioproprionate lyase family protein [bacterium]